MRPGPDTSAPRRLALLITLMAVLLQVAWAVAADGVVSRQTIVRQLSMPPDGERGLVPVEDVWAGPPAAGPPAAGLPAPSIQLPSITFEHDSSELTAAARVQLDELVAALAAPELRAFRFRIIGHTDAHGSRRYNQALSERRAAAVRDYLLRVGRLEADRLEAAGRGQEQPARPEDPWAAENRRVEIQNLGVEP